MRRYVIIPLTLAALLLAGASCIPPGQQPSTDQTAPVLDAEVNAPPGRRLQLRQEDGKPLPGNAVRKTHTVGRSPCPDPVDDVVVDLGAPVPEGCKLTPQSLPQWLTHRDRQSRQALIGQGILVGLEFNCNVTDRSPHTVEVKAGYALDCQGQDVTVGDWKHGDPVELPVILELK